MSFVEYRIPNHPFMPETVDVNEESAMLESWSRAGATWEEILACMAEDSRQYRYYYTTQVARFRDLLGMSVCSGEGAKSVNRRAATQANGTRVAWNANQLQRNSGRGVVSGLVDPLAAPVTIVHNWATNTQCPNWIPYPDKYKHPHEDRDKNIRAQQTKYLKDTAKARDEVKSAQTKGGPPMPAPDTLADATSTQKRGAADEAAGRVGKKPRQSHALGQTEDMPAMQPMRYQTASPTSPISFATTPASVNELFTPRDGLFSFQQMSDVAQSYHGQGPVGAVPTNTGMHFQNAHLYGHEGTSGDLGAYPSLSQGREHLCGIDLPQLNYAMQPGFDPPDAADSNSGPPENVVRNSAQVPNIAAHSQSLERMLALRDSIRPGFWESEGLPQNTGNAP